MLKLVLGGSGSGKTSYLYAQLARRAAEGQRSILLVPEQFRFVGGSYEELCRLLVENARCRKISR